MNKQEYKIEKIKFFNRIAKLIEEEGLEKVLKAVSQTAVEEGLKKGIFVGIVISSIIFTIYLLVK